MASSTYQLIRQDLTEPEWVGDVGVSGSRTQDTTQEGKAELSRAATSGVPYLGDPIALIRNLAIFLIPSFLKSTTTTEKRAKTKYAALDGLRGLACLCVLNQHHTTPFTGRLYQYGFMTAPTDVYVPQWPLVRVLVSHTNLNMYETAC
jgi:hypothetical protein